MPESRLRSTGHSRTRLVGVGVLTVAFAGAAACAESSFELPTSGDISLVLTVSPTGINAGEEALVSTSVVGTQLSGTIIDYGDGFIDSLPAFGAQTQTRNCRKGYNEPGTFVITATADDAQQGKLSRQDTIVVDSIGTVLPPSGPSSCEETNT